MLFSELIKYATKAKLQFAYTLANSKEASSADILKENDVAFNKAWADSREIKENDLFICIQGDNTDGHNFITKAIENKASIIVAKLDKLQELDILPLPVFYLENPEKDIMAIAHTKRMDFEGKVIGITGSAGKTTTKEILSQLLEAKGIVAKNHKNYNTQLGLSLSILNANNTEDFWTLEAGISHEHDMDEIAAILRPDIALVLNAGLAHAEGLPKGAAYYKSKLFRYLKNENSKAIASADYEDLLTQSKINYSDTLYFSTKDTNCSIYSKYIGKSEQNSAKGLYELTINNEKAIIEAPFFGEYGAENVAALSVISTLCGLSLEEIKEAFAKVSLPSQRFEVHLIETITLIDDSYNANPLSFARMIDAAVEYTKDAKGNKIKDLVCLIGSMGELGNEAIEAHKALGAYVADKAQVIYYTGNFQNEFEEGLAKNSFSGKLAFLTSPEDFANTLYEQSFSSVVFLVKGSRVHALEKYTKTIKSFYELKYVL